MSLQGAHPDDDDAISSSSPSGPKSLPYPTPTAVQAASLHSSALLLGVSSCPPPPGRQPQPHQPLPHTASPYYVCRAAAPFLPSPTLVPSNCFSRLLLLVLEHSRYEFSRVVILKESCDPATLPVQLEAGHWTACRTPSLPLRWPSTSSCCGAPTSHELDKHALTSPTRESCRSIQRTHQRRLEEPGRHKGTMPFPMGFVMSLM